jgi:hypothetical protein
MATMATRTVITDGFGKAEVLERKKALLIFRRAFLFVKMEALVA